MLPVLLNRHLPPYVFKGGGKWPEATKLLLAQNALLGLPRAGGARVGVVAVDHGEAINVGRACSATGALHGGQLPTS